MLGPYGVNRMHMFMALIYRTQMVLGWTWRSMLGGEEQYLHGILGHDGIPTQNYPEYKQAASDFVFSTLRPGTLEDVFGLRVAYFRRYAEDASVINTEITGPTQRAALNCPYRENLELHTATSFAQFEDGTCAISEYKFGAGKAYYVATDTRSQVMRELGYVGEFSVPEGVRVRKIAEGQYFYVNTLGKEVVVPLNADGYGVLSEKEQAGTLILSAFDAELVVSEKKQR